MRKKKCCVWRCLTFYFLLTLIGVFFAHEATGWLGLENLANPDSPKYLGAWGWIILFLFYFAIITATGKLLELFLYNKG